MKIISNNPYRLLGVYSNSSVKDRIANANKLKAYLKVGKSVNFPLDLSDFMPTPIRTVESMEYASSGINLLQDQLKYALFWFINDSPIDDIAFAYLQKGDIEKAKELFGKKETFSSLINQGVLSLVQDNKATAIKLITKMIHDDDYRDTFIEAVCDSSCRVLEDELSQLFMDALLTEVPAQELMQLFLDNGISEKDNVYLKNKAVSEPIAIINAKIAKAKAVKNSDAETQYQAGVSLMNSTKEPLIIVREFLKAGDMQYQIVVDNLAKQILQCGINYYNNADEEEAIKIDKAYKLQNYAYSIAIGKLVNDRCRENVAILEKKKRELPPITIKIYDNFIKNEIVQYQALADSNIYDAIELMKKCTPYLMSIKDELGSTNSYYLKLSTLIVSLALYNVIEEFNSVTNDTTLQIDLLIDRERTIRRINYVFKEAWTAILYMDRLDMEESFKYDRYSQNRASLKEQVESMGISTCQIIQIEMRSDTQLFNDCKSIPNCKRYLEIFPNGKFVSEVKVKMEECEFNACVTTRDCFSFKKKYPNTKLPISQKWEDCYFKTCKTIEDYEGYLRTYSNGRFVISARSKIETMIFKRCKTLDEYKMYLQKYPSGDHKDEAMQIIADEECWMHCISSNAGEEYRDYLIRFPKGRHKTEAQRKIDESGGWDTLMVISWAFLISMILILIVTALNN